VTLTAAGLFTVQVKSCHFERTVALARPSARTPAIVVKWSGELVWGYWCHGDRRDRHGRPAAGAR
jgi:hypothetical protein